MHNTYSLATQLKSHQSLQLFKPLQLGFNIPMPNIFKTQEILRITEKGFISSKHYEVVGIKELKNFELKMRKGTKLSTRRHEENVQRPISKQSQSKKHSLLTKQEVLSGLPKLQNPRNLVKVKKTLGRICQATQYDDTIQKKVEKKSPLRNEFSVSRLKNILRQRENEWIQLQNKEKSYKRDTQKFPNIYRSVELYRSKLEEKERAQQADFSIAKKNTQWQKSLRKTGTRNKELSAQKNLERIFHDDGQFSAKGSSKLKLQTEWIEHKDKDGYQFKLISSQILSKRESHQKLR